MKSAAALCEWKAPESLWLLWLSPTQAQTRLQVVRTRPNILLLCGPTKATHLHFRTCLRHTVFASVLRLKKKRKKKGTKRWKAKREIYGKNDRIRERERNTCIPTGQTRRILCEALWSPEGENKHRWSEALYWGGGGGGVHATACTCTNWCQIVRVWAEIQQLFLEKPELALLAILLSRCNTSHCVLYKAEVSLLWFCSQQNCYGMEVRGGSGVLWRESEKKNSTTCWK